MTQEVYLILAIVNMILLFFMWGPNAMRLSIFMALKKNPEWIATHPEFKIHKTFELIAVWFHYLLGIGSALAIIYFTLVVPTPDYYIKLLIIPLQLLAHGFLIIMGGQYFWLARSIPTPKITQASLTERKLSRFIPIWVYVAVNVFLAITTILYGYIYFAELREASFALTQFISFCFGFIFLNLAILFSVRRKHSESDFMFGKFGRKTDIWIMIAMMLFLAVVGVIGVIRDFFGGWAISEMMFLVGIILFAQIMALYFQLHPKNKSMLKEYKNLTSHHQTKGIKT